MAAAFSTNRALLNPKFEGYKLDPIPQDKAVSRYALLLKPTQATASTRAPLSFEEMRSRITHNHLSVDSDSGLALYVDQDYNVCLIGVATNEDNPSPSFRVLYEMPAPMDTSSDSADFAVHREYPSSAFLGAGAVAVTDGNGLLYVLPIKDEIGVTEPIGIFTLRTGGPFAAPFRIHHIHRASPIAATLLLSSRYYPPNSQKTSTITGNGQTHTEFDIWAVKIELLSLRVGAQQRELELLWHRRGQDVPIYTTFIDEVKSYLIIGSSSYPDPSVTYAKRHEPTQDELVTISGGIPDIIPVGTSSLSENPEKPYPYSWTQTSDTVTVAFPLPSNTLKNKFKVIFTMQTLTLHVDSHPLQSSDSPVPIPHYTSKAFWDSVNTSSCFWTWDREAEHSYGLLTLHMEKKNDDTRWMQVFATSATSTGSDDADNGDVEVPESVDPSEMIKIRESMEKWTANLASGDDASGLGLGRGVPSLMEGEVDEEADASIGRCARATWVGERGETPEWCQTDRNKTGQQWEDEPINLLSVPMPGSAVSPVDVGLVLKNDLDGTVFSLEVSEPSPAPNGPYPRWEHTSTYSALAFVLASKQDTRFTYHLPSHGVFAFEGGSARDRGANVYVYRPPSKGKSKEIWAKQSVLQVVDGSGGALLGVGCLNVKDEKQGMTLVCLTEAELVLIRCV